MKKMLNTAFAYLIAGLAGGVFYREFTKWNGFAGRTSLGFVHGHLLALGTLFFLLMALFALHTDVLQHRQFGRFFAFYNVGLCSTAVLMAVRGVAQVLGLPLSKGADAAISGVAGLGHIALAVGMVLAFVCLKNCSEKENQTH